MTYWVEIENLQKQIGRFQLGPIDLNIGSGTITAVVGNNGSGKSTLFKLIMGLVKPDAGEIHMFRKRQTPNDESWKQKVAYLPQTVIGANPFTGETLKKMISGLYPDWDEALFQKLTALFQVPLQTKYGKMSAGLKQKLNLALTISRNAPFLILDEPTAHMDIPAQKMVSDILHEWMEEGERAIILATNQAEILRKLSDYLFVLQDGKMIGHFEKETLTERYKEYWSHDALPAHPIPGEVLRDGRTFITSRPEAAEHFLMEQNVTWTNRKGLDLEEILSLVMQSSEESLRPNEMANDE